MDFRKIRTDFVRRKLKETPWENRGYINVLMLLENAIIDGVKSYIHGMWWFHMKEAYEFEVAAIKRELALGRPLTDNDLDEIKAELKHEKDLKLWKNRQESMQAEEDARRRMEAEQEAWREMGGRV